jgi:hypothetical protein
VGNDVNTVAEEFPLLDDVIRNRLVETVLLHSYTQNTLRSQAKHNVREGSCRHKQNKHFKDIQKNIPIREELIIFTQVSGHRFQMLQYCKCVEWNIFLK